MELIKRIRNVSYAVAGIVAVLSIICVIVGANGKIPAGTADILNRIPYLQWSDDWGNGRGFTWRFTGNMFWNMDVIKKLFGVGPECYADYSYEFGAADLHAMWGNLVLTNAHNEWLTAVINYGVMGAAAYLGIFLMAAKRFIEKSAGFPILIGIAACVLSYAGHNFFCYQTIVCTPFIFMLMGIGEWYRRKHG